MVSQKINVILLFGGRSGEHEVSIASAESVLEALDKEKYEVTQICIGHDGVWRTSDEQIRFLVPVPGINHLLTSTGEQAEKVDVVLSMIHGTFGEDGCLQGLLEMAELPYVGSGVLGSALGMDKEVQKNLLKSMGVPVVDFLTLRFFEWEKNNEEKLKLVKIFGQNIGYPNFIKPANAGSSVGITKAHNERELEQGITIALQYDLKIIIEKAVLEAREIECAVLGGENPQASVLGEIKPGNEFYDYEAKYKENSGTELFIPASLDQTLTQQLRELAIKTFRVLEARGLGRVDFLMNKKTGEYFVNEINTLPGFTKVSMYPKLWEAAGVSYQKLLCQLIDLAIEHAAIKRNLNRSYLKK